MTDESILATGGAIVGEVEHQLAVSIANKIDADVMAQATATAVVAGIPVAPKQIASATIITSRSCYFKSVLWRRFRRYLLNR